MKKHLFISIGLIFTFFLAKAVFDFSDNKLYNDKFEIRKMGFNEILGRDGLVNVIVLKKKSLSYEVVNKNHRSYDFYMNANYFTKENIPVGEVIINKKTYSKINNGTGFFTTDGNTPSFSYVKHSKDVKYSCQTHTPLIRNGNGYPKIFSKKWAKIKLPRLVIGENKYGDIIIIHTIEDTRCSVSEMYEISKNQGMVNALMFDGGASIEIGLRYKNFKYRYQIVSDLERKFFNVPTPSVFIVGNFN